MANLKRNISDTDNSDLTTSNKRTKKTIFNKHKKFLEFCVESEITQHELNTILKKYCDTKILRMYVENKEWEAEYNRMIDKSFNCFVNFTQDCSRDEFAKQFKKFKPNIPLLYKWISREKVIEIITRDMTLLHEKYKFDYKYTRLLKLYTDNYFDVQSVHRYIDN